MKRTAITAAVLALSVATLTGCGLGGKVTEPYQDASIGNRNNEPADVGTMPDGFSNYASKCDRPGIRVYVIFKGDYPYGALSPIADPTCK